ncbi:DNA-binding Lrp family transcriptional regulator [Hydrogenivirga caldilitoris]|uniref:siroheme decarboxylase n=1 Tax=Hydrogenivirga caldilitoris TaxID=246264 RepID=A0A497XVL6_9AQUI|nr:Lrp/AsnC family transcriptional regulator [Hydrogenivirga caldilitoris]RLJ70843.1 DNA-binding Lrp family transcriptional regulator [Hydrogenivirga caldilitoris]
MLREELLKEIQSNIPIVSRPFKYLGERLGVDEGEVIKAVKSLKEEGIIRQVSPIYDTKAAGYDSSLVAFKVPRDRILEVAKLVNTHPGVSHNYEREHDFNLWFTLAVPPDGEMSLEETVSLLAKLGKVEGYVVLRTLKTYKIGVKLDYKELTEREEVKIQDRKKTQLTELEKEVIRVSQKDIPLVEAPFAELAKTLGVTEEEFLQTLRVLQNKGVMRRFSAILFHRRAGFRANGMAVWRVPEDRIDQIGIHLASYKSVSHCYWRTTNQHWSYNLFSMIHGKTKEEVLSFVEKVGEEVGIYDRETLFSTREFKKRRVELFSEEFYEWEREKLSLHTY